MSNYYWNLRKVVGKIPLIINAAGVVLMDENRKILLQKRTDNNKWSIPGGCVDLGEIIEEAAKREVFEETNLVVEDLQLFNVYSGEEQHHVYPDGNEVYFTNIVYITNKYKGIMKVDGIEGTELKFFSIENLPEEITPSNCPILEDVKRRICTYF